MSQQGGRPTGHEDDWWRQLYDSADDTGPTRAPDTLDDRFASAAGAVDEQSHRPGTGVPAPRTGVSDATAPATGGRRASWEPPPDAPSSFPPGPKPPGFVERAPEDRPPRPPGGPASAETPPAPAVPASRRPTEPPRPPTTAPPHPATPPRPAAPPPPPRDAERAVAPGAGDPGGPVAWDGADASPARGDAGRPVPPGRDDSRGPGTAGAGSGEAGSGEGPVSAATASVGRAEDVPPPGRPESPRGPSERGGPGTQPGGADWWAAPGDPDPAPGPAQQTPAVAPPPRTGPGSTQPNPTPEPPGHGPADDPRHGGPAEAPTPPRPVSAPQAPRTATRVDLPAVGHVGSGPPTYDAEPTALPPADPDELDDLVADTVLDGARYGACTLRAVSVRGDSARFRGEPRRDSLLTARFGTGDQALILVAMATGARATPGAHRAAAEACHWIGRAVGRSHARLAQDISAARRGDLKSGLHRLTDRSLGKLRASAVEQGIDPEEYAATLRCLLLPADPDCRVRVFFGVGAGGLFRLRDGEWHDIEPRITDVTGEPVVGFGSLPSETPDGDRLTMDLGIPTPPSPYEPAPGPPREAFRFRASVARPGDTLLMCTSGLADPLRGEPELCDHLTGRWSGPPPGLAAFLADSQVRVKGYADDRTAAAVWEA
ncbi:protein phosphatase 2C domain-containing protein [Streptomyces sp. NPDC005483]|uniref:protein phosphatase 2C domain-containing protein n=1 Tax=Streptomyces sp. NPDC005483 TaxID=3154882 RepID=UPI0033BF63B0